MRRWIALFAGMIQPNGHWSKAHSVRHAAELLRLGWTLAHQKGAGSNGKSYEYLFEWLRDDPVKYPRADPSEWGTQ